MAFGSGPPVGAKEEPKGRNALRRLGGSHLMNPLPLPLLPLRGRLPDVKSFALDLCSDVIREMQ